MKISKRILSSVICLAVIFSFTSCSPLQTTEQRFDKYLTDVFTSTVTGDSMTLHYLIKNPENFGIKDFEPTLGEIYAEDEINVKRRIEAFIGQLKAYNYDELTDEQQRCYDILLNLYETELSAYNLGLYFEPLDARYGIQTSLPTNFAEYEFLSEDDVNNYIKLLEDVGRYFDQIIEFEKKKSEEGLFMSDIELSKILSQCGDFTNEQNNYLISIFPEKLADISLTEEQAQIYTEQNSKAVKETVIPAYKKLIEEMQKLKGTGKNQAGLCGYPLGKNYYEYMVKKRSGSDKTVAEISEIIDSNIQKYLARRIEMTKEHPDLWNEYNSFKYDYTDPDIILSYLKENIAADFPLLPEVSYEIKYVDKSMENTSGHAFYFVPPIDDINTNLIYVNGNSIYKDIPLYPTMAHEGYPGHLYQSVYFNNKKPNPLRLVYTNTGYAEGWATYAEMYSFRYSKASDYMAEIIELQELLNMAVYTRADIGVNYEGWTAKDIYSNLLETGLSEKYAAYLEEISITCEGHMIPYYVGYIEIEELKEYAEKQLGDKFSIKDFHTALLDGGPLPFPALRTQIEKWVSSVK